MVGHAPTLRRAGEQDKNASDASVDTVGEVPKLMLAGRGRTDSSRKAMARDGKKSAGKKRKPATRLQYAALAYRETKSNGVEILLMTSRETKRWIIPKGWPIKGLKPSESAAQEAYEEAGVRGAVGRRPIGKYTYEKRLNAPSKVVPCEVQVYALKVRRQDETWPENGQRELRWCQPEVAIATVDDRELAALMTKFVVAGKGKRLPENLG